MPTPSWVNPMNAGSPAPQGYDQLLAQSRLRLAQQPALPTPPAQPAPQMPPGLREVFDRLPPQAQQTILQRLGGGADAGGEGTRDPWGTAGRRGPLGANVMGPGYAKVSAGLGAIIPGAGLLFEGGRRLNNTAWANRQRDMLGIDKPGFWGDFFSGIGGGRADRSIGTVNIGGRGPTQVSRGGMVASGRTSYTSEEARRRQMASRVDRSGGGYGGGDLDRASRAATGERTSSPGGMGGM
jgi:hypothetical protein